MNQEGSAVIKVVLDTNVLVSSVFWVGNPHKIVELAIDRKIQAFTSPEILQEFENALNRDFLEDHDFIDSQIALVLEYSEIVWPSSKVDLVKEDSEDNKILECALSAGADYIITGDPHLLNLKQIKDTKIITPSGFMAIFGL